MFVGLGSRCVSLPFPGVVLDLLILPYWFIISAEYPLLRFCAVWVGGVVPSMILLFYHTCTLQLFLAAILSGEVIIDVHVCCSWCK